MKTIDDSAMIKLYQIDRIWNDLREEIIDLTDQWLIQGLAQGSTVSDAIEADLSSYAQRRFCTLTANGSDALAIAVSTLDLPRGSKIAVPAYTWISTATAILRNGHVPVFVDVSDNYTIQVKDLPDCDAVIAVDLLGNSCDWQALERLSVPVINDSAQSFQTKYQDKSSLSRGIVSCASFSPLKTLPSFGSGGAVFTDSPDIDTACKRMRLHDKGKNHIPADRVGFNSTMSSFEISAITVALKYQIAWMDRRHHIAKYYNDRIANKFTVISDITNRQNNLHKFVIESTKRDKVVEALRSQGIDCQTPYLPLYDEPVMMPYKNKALSRTEKIRFCSLSIPNQHTLTDGEVEYIADTLVKL